MKVDQERISGEKGIQRGRKAETHPQEEGGSGTFLRHPARRTGSPDWSSRGLRDDARMTVCVCECECVCVSVCVSVSVCV